MTPELRAETDKLTQSWMRHSPEVLRDYLVASVEDPRINLQSILTRHFLIRASWPGQFEELMHEEYRFAAAMAAALRLMEGLHHPEEKEIVLHALGRGSDNAEGIEIPSLLVQCYKSLPRQVSGAAIPHYLKQLFETLEFRDGRAVAGESVLETFAVIWSSVLRGSLIEARVPAMRIRVLEPACGSANDCRFFPRYGVDQLIDYTGFDLAPANVENARALFPSGQFDVGNVFDIHAANRAFQGCFVHDLFEHLSIEGLHAAVGEVCRVTSDAICAHFFNLDEIPEHKVLPVEDYHWNTLSLRRVLDLFAGQGFQGHVVNIGTFLQRTFEAQPTHNPNAYTLYFKRLKVA